MPLTNAERTKLARAIKTEAYKLYQYRDAIVDQNPQRQAAIDNDLQVLHERLREINTNTGVDSQWLNNQ